MPPSATPQKNNAAGSDLSQIPRKVYLYWADGFDKAPEVVSLCVSSWEKMNPDFEIIQLDDSNLGEYVDLDTQLPGWRNLTIQKLSNLIRMEIITRRGGYWADATLLCLRPMSEWVNPRPPMGFFGLRPRANQSGRTVHTFFMGSVPGGEFATVWKKAYQAYLSSGVRQMSRGTQKRWQKRYPLLFQTLPGSLVWTSPLVGRRIGYPYLVAHYIANRLIIFSRRARKMYRQTQHLPLEALAYCLLPDGFEQWEAAMVSGAYPVTKLTWRTDVKPEFWRKVMARVRLWHDTELAHAKSGAR